MGTDTNTKSVEYRLHIQDRQEARGGIDNQFLITGFSMITLSLP